MADQPEPAGRSFLIDREGDLLEADQQYIVHQTNCVTRSARGLAADIFRRFPHADVYNAVTRSRRETIAGDVPGTVAVMGEGAADPERGVINLFGQYGPGRPRGRDDSAEVRLGWFERGLAEIAELRGLSSLAFPALIGCGYGGGDPARYREALERFAARVAERGVVVVLYRESPPPPAARHNRGRAHPRAARAFAGPPVEAIDLSERPATS